jgi:hypothetical protein
VVRETLRQLLDDDPHRLYRPLARLMIRQAHATRAPFNFLEQAGRIRRGRATRSRQRGSSNASRPRTPRVLERFPRAGARAAQDGLELGDGLLDRRGVGRVGRDESRLYTPSSHRVTAIWCHMSSQRAVGRRDVEYSGNTCRGDTCVARAWRAR